ncbi:MAG: peptide chain release factor 1 [Spartobacteria bacterium]|nr:peptide chain release factor 1 [Spartobacteria bacterium]
MIERDYMDKVTARLSDVESELANPATVSNLALYRKLMAEHAYLKDLEIKADVYFSCLDQEAECLSIIGDGSDADLVEMAQEELDVCRENLPSMEKELMIALLPPRPEDSRNTIFEIRAGTGGDEAALFAADLYRMYARFCEEKGWKLHVIDVAAASIGGYKEVIFAVEGENVYRTMRYESGVHRVQRVPVTESSGRIHTSAATVAVLPEAEEFDAIDFRPDEIRIDVYRASGAGGQHVNTTDSAVRITHIPTGIVAQSQDERSQHRNKEIAMRVLKAKLLDQKQQEEANKYADARRSQVGTGDRSERIRTYNYPQNRVTDHRINLTLYCLDRIMEGDLDALTAALSERDVEDRLSEQLKG